MTLPLPERLASVAYELSSVIDSTPRHLEVLRSMLGRAGVALPSPPTRLHELGLVRPVPVRGGDDAWEITRAGVGAHCAGRSSEAIWLSDEQAAPAQLLAA